MVCGYLQEDSKNPTVSTKSAFQQFLPVYQLTPNKNKPSAMIHAKTIFGRKIRSVFDKLIPKKKKVEYTAQKAGNKFYKVGENFITEFIRREKDIGKLEI